MSRSTAPEFGTAGFTVLEVLVALAILAMSLSSIGALMAATVHGTRSIERRFAQLEIARTIIAALPDRDELGSGRLSGDLAGHRWRVDVTPYSMSVAPQLQPPQWVAQAVSVTVNSPAGGTLQVDTIRLHRVADK